MSDLKIPKAVLDLCATSEGAQRVAQEIATLTSSFGWELVSAVLDEQERASVSAFRSGSNPETWADQSAYLRAIEAIRGIPQALLARCRRDAGEDEEFGFNQ